MTDLTHVFSAFNLIDWVLASILCLVIVALAVFALVAWPRRAKAPAELDLLEHINPGEA